MLKMGIILLPLNLDQHILNRYNIAFFGKMFVKKNVSLKGNWTKHEEGKNKRQRACCMFLFSQTFERITNVIKQ
jgi:hypothetical protein